MNYDSKGNLMERFIYFRQAERLDYYPLSCIGHRHTLTVVLNVKPLLIK